MTARNPTRQATRSKPTELNSPDFTHEIVRRAFGDVLRSLRLRVGLSQVTFAKQFQLDRTYVSQLERGRSEPTLGFLFRISPGLKVSPAIIMALIEHRVGAMQDCEFDRSTSPVIVRRPHLRSARPLDDIPKTPRVCRAVAMLVRALRLRAEWNHNDYAKIAGIHRTYQNQIEDGETNPTVTTILRLSTGAGVPAESFVGAVELLIQANPKKTALNRWLQQLPS